MRDTYGDWGSSRRSSCSESASRSCCGKVVAVKARMRERVDAEAMIADVNRVEVELKRAFPDIRWSFFEPDVTD